MFSVGVAYVLGILSFIPPFSGLLRFYLKRHGHGIIYSLTAGCCWIGNILDIVQVPQLVKEANMRRKRLELAHYASYPQLEDSSPNSAQPVSNNAIEQAVLRSAKKNGGMTTPSEVALEASIPIEEARKSLDYLVSKGFAEMRVNRSGVIAYFFPDIIDPSRKEEFEELT